MCATPARRVKGCHGGPVRATGAWQAAPRWGQVVRRGALERRRGRWVGVCVGQHPKAEGHTAPKQVSTAERTAPREFQNRHRSPRGSHS